MSERGGPSGGLANPRRVTLGRIVGHFGVRGWLKVESYTQPPEAILKYRQWMVETPHAQARLEVEQGRRQGQQIVVHFVEHDDRDASARWLGGTVSVYRSELPDLGPREYYQDDLIGFCVRSLDGRRLGRVAHFIDGPVHGFMVVRSDGTEPTMGEETWVPATTQHLRRVDLARGEVHVDWQAPED